MYTLEQKGTSIFSLLFSSSSRLSLYSFGSALQVRRKHTAKQAMLSCSFRHQGYPIISIVEKCESGLFEAAGCTFTVAVGSSAVNHHTSPVYTSRWIASSVGCGIPAIRPRSSRIHYRSSFSTHSILYSH